jgi:hypothetical protein
MLALDRCNLIRLELERPARCGGQNADHPRSRGVGRQHDPLDLAAATDQNAIGMDEAGHRR